MRPSGFNGSTVLPLQLTLQKTCSSAIGRLAATLVRGPVVDVQEAALEPWLQSPLLIGGLDAAASATFSDAAVAAVRYKHSDTNTDTGSVRAIAAEVTPARPSTTSIGSAVSDEQSQRPLHVDVISDTKNSSVTTTQTVQQVDKKERKESNDHPLSWADAWRKVQQTCDPPDHGRSHGTANGNLKEVTRDVSLSDGERTPSMEANDTAVTADETTLFLFDLCRVGSSSLLEGSSTSTDISAARLLPWLERIAPEPSSLRSVLERSGSYSFPQCEFPFIACLLKHSGLVREAMGVLQALKEGKDVDDPSSDMIAMWKRVQQLRTFLRQQRQKYKAMNTTTTATGSGTGTTSSTSNAVTIVAPSEQKVEPPVVPPGPGSLSTLARIFASDGESAGEVESTAAAVSAPANPPRGNFEITTISEGDTSSSNAAHADSSPDHPAATPSPVPSASNAALVAEIMAGESVLYHDGDGRGITWCAQPEGTLSVYVPASGYRCTVLSFGEMYDNAFAYVRFAVHGDGSLGPLQAPGLSGLTLVASGRALIFSSPDVFYARYKPAEEIVGCMRFSLGIDSTGADVFDTMLSMVGDDSLVVTFNYGTGGYSAAVLRVTGAAARAADTTRSDAELLQDLEPTVFGAQHDDDDVKVDSVPHVGDSDGGPKTFDEVCVAVQAKALFLLRVAPARGCLDADGAKSKAALLSLMDHYTVLGSGGYSRGGSTGGGSRPSRMMRFKSFDGQDRWRRVIEFLRVHTKIRRQISADTLGGEISQQGSNTPRHERDGDVMTGTITPTRDTSAGYAVTRTLSRSESKQDAYGMVFEQVDDALEEQDSAQHDIARKSKPIFPSADMIEISGRARSLTAVDEDLEMYSNGNSKRDSNGAASTGSRVRSGDGDGMSPVQAAMQACAVFCTCNAAAADAHAQVLSPHSLTPCHSLLGPLIACCPLRLAFRLFPVCFCMV